MRVALPTVLLPVVVFLLYILVPGLRERPWTVARIVGAVTAAVGWVFTCMARTQLGASFSVRPRAKELVTHGLYSRLRNPMYIFVDVTLFGLILTFEMPWLFLVLAGLMVSQTLQAQREANVLQQRFGQTYIDYRRQTWF